MYVSAFLTFTVAITATSLSPLGLVCGAERCERTQGSTLRVLGDFEPGWDSSWDTQQLGGDETSYRMVEDGGGRVLRADADGSATAFYHRLERRRVREQVAWRWKVSGSLPDAIDERSRAGDDYAARLFVIFGDGEMGRGTRALCYVWARGEPVESIYPSPVVDSVKTVVLRTGDAQAGQWVPESRDLDADYRRAFGSEPEAVAAIALMVDTDDTGGRITAWFDDLELR